MISSARSCPSDCSSTARANWAPPRSDVGAGGRQVAELREHRARSRPRRRLELERSRRRSPRPRPRAACASTLAACSRPSWIRRMAALRTPDSVRVVVIISGPPPRASRAAAAATSSGWRSTMAAISSRAAIRSWSRAEPVSSAAGRVRRAARRRVVAQPQLLDDVRRGLVAQLAALAAAEPGQQQRSAAITHGDAAGLDHRASGRALASAFLARGEGGGGGLLLRCGRTASW